MSLHFLQVYTVTVKWCGINLCIRRIVSCIEHSIKCRREKSFSYCVYWVLIKGKMYSTIFNEKEKLWTGLSRTPFYNVNLSLGQALLHSLESNPNKIVQVILMCLVCISISFRQILISDQRQQRNDADE